MLCAFGVAKACRLCAGRNGLNYLISVQAVWAHGNSAWDHRVPKKISPLSVETNGHTKKVGFREGGWHTFYKLPSEFAFFNWPETKGWQLVVDGLCPRNKKKTNTITKYFGPIKRLTFLVMLCSKVLNKERECHWLNESLTVQRAANGF